MPLDVEDRTAIAELAARYCWAIDHHDADAWAALFTADGALVANGQLRAQGQAALHAYVDVRRRTGVPQLRHWITNLLVEGEGDRATLRAYVAAFDIAGPLGAPYVMGEYRDDVVRVDGRWLFETRRMAVVAGASATGR